MYAVFLRIGTFQHIHRNRILCFAGVHTPVLFSVSERIAHVFAENQEKSRFCQEIQFANPVAHLCPCVHRCLASERNQHNDSVLHPAFDIRECSAFTKHDKMSAIASGK